MNHSEAIEWRHKVGVVGICDGSAKATVRLLCFDDQVFKTDLAKANENINILQDDIALIQQQEKKLGIWHPSKDWFIFYHNNTYIPCSVCARLVTLRNLRETNVYWDWWIKMICLNIKMIEDFGISLDLNPANFGVIEKKIYYIDDEIYHATNYMDIGLFIAQRMFEEHKLVSGLWENFGKFLRKAITSMTTKKQIQAIWEGVNSYPLKSKIQNHQQAFQQGFCKK